MNDASSYGDADRATAIVHLEFAEEISYMNVDGLFADSEGHGDFLISFALRDQLDDLDLAFRQCGLPGSLGEPRLQLRRNSALTRMNLTHHTDELVRQR